MGELKKNKKMKIFKSLGVIVALLVAFFMGNYISRYGVVFGADGDEVAAALKYSDVIKDYEGLFEVREELYKFYLEDINEDDLVDGAIKGMTNSLKDPYTVYMNDEEFIRFMKSNSGEFKGIGVYIKVKDEKVTIDSPISGGPAEKAGLKAGDVIVKVEGEEIGSDSSKAVSLITGEEDTEVTITIARGGEEKDYTIKRETIKTESVKGEMLTNNIGYINLSTFNENVSKDFEKELSKLSSEGMKGLIFDLRGNGGGYLKEAITIASQFIPKGEVVNYTIDKAGNKEVRNSEGGIAQGLPLVILTDGGSASASEVVIGALKDYNAGVTVGTKTFGKGIVQYPFALESSGGLKVTISKYYTPKGNDIHKIGITPDYEVLLKEEDLLKEYSKETDPQLQKGITVLQDMIK